MSTYRYLPLKRYEIRLLTIECADSQIEDSAPIVCSLEHVCLKPLTEDASSGAWFKGQDSVWPEVLLPYNSSIIFQDGIDPSAETNALRNTALPPNDDDQLRWRHEWGDFVALSYVWGAKENVKTITLDGVQVSIMPNLYYALRQLRCSLRVRQGFKVWADALCINQADLIERGQQVARMRDIYQSAWQVVIWLGMGTDESLLALTALDWLAQRSTQSVPLENFYRETKMLDARPLFIAWPRYKSRLRKVVYKALFDFFTNPYWRRIWVLQEVAMGRQHTPVLLGSRGLPWASICDASALNSADEARFGHAIINSYQARTLGSPSFEVGRGRRLTEGDWAGERMWKMPIAMMQIQQKQRLEGGLGDAKDLIDILALCRDANVTEEKDRVYGVLGIKAVADRVVILPDYTLPLRKLYIDFSMKLLTSGSLDALRLASRYAGTDAFIPAERQPLIGRPCDVKGRPWTTKQMSKLSRKQQVAMLCTHNLPSWTVCWTCKPLPTVRFRRKYRAGGAGIASVPVSICSGLGIQVRGVILDTIHSLGAFHWEEVDGNYPMNGDATLHCNAYGDLKKTRVALWRTLVTNTNAEGTESAPQEYSWLLEPDIWQQGIANIHTHGFGLELLMARNSKLNLCGYTLEQIIFGPNKNRHWWEKIRTKQYDVTKIQLEAYSWAVDVLAWRRLMGTKNGRIGLGAAGAKVGDSIAVLVGCSTPLILRKLGLGWVVISECYVEGVMYGEAIDSEVVGKIDIL